MPAWLASALHLTYRNDGIQALNSLMQQFDATNVNDQAAALSRVQARYIDSRAEISEADLRHQHTSMMMAHAQYVCGGGTALPQPMLKVLFDNSLPISYAVFRQHVRRAAHASLDLHFADEEIPHLAAAGQAVS